MFKRRNLVTLLAGTFLVASGAMAQFADRNIKFTNGVNEDHPVGVGVKKMQEVLAAKTGGKMKITAFWGGAAGGEERARGGAEPGREVGAGRDGDDVDAVGRDEHSDHGARVPSQDEPRRAAGLLGTGILGQAGFDFDIAMQTEADQPEWAVPVIGWPPT